VTQPKIQRALPAGILQTAAKELSNQVDVIPDVDQAVAAAIESSGPDDAVCIAGSLYVVGEAKTALTGQIPPVSL
jgi:dihydrofolate synthase/folylpolyglutamate synthase